MEILYWILGLAGIILSSILVIRTNIRFDFNEWRRDRRRVLDENIRILCPHVRVSSEGGRYTIHSTYISPSGTLAWQCQMCGDVTHDQQSTEAVQKYWANNLDKLAERHKKMEKLARKLGRN